MPHITIVVSNMLLRELQIEEPKFLHNTQITSKLGNRRGILSMGKHRNINCSHESFRKYRTISDIVRVLLVEWLERFTRRELTLTKAIRARELPPCKRLFSKVFISLIPVVFKFPLTYRISQICLLANLVSARIHRGQIQNSESDCAITRQLHGMRATENLIKATKSFHYLCFSFTECYLPDSALKACYFCGLYLLEQFRAGWAKFIITVFIFISK